MTLEAFDQLAVIAQISATLLGFISVFLVLSSGEGRFSESDRHFIQALVLAGAMALVFSLVPGALSSFFVGDMLWLVSLVVAAICGTVLGILEARAQFRMTPEEAAQIHWGWHVAAWGLGATASVFIVSGLFGFGDPEAMFISAMYIFLLLAIWSFIAVVFRKFF